MAHSLDPNWKKEYETVLLFTSDSTGLPDYWSVGISALADIDVYLADSFQISPDGDAEAVVFSLLPAAVLYENNSEFIGK